MSHRPEDERAGDEVQGRSRGPAGPPDSRAAGRRAARWTVLGLAWLATGVGAAVSAEEWKRLLDGFSDGGSSYFFTPEICAVMRGALLWLGPTVTLAAPLRRRLRRSSDAAPAGAPPAPGFRALQLALAAGIALSGLGRWAADPPVTKDTKFYLSESLDIARQGGLAALPGRCFRGEYLEENRHPLYPGVLAPVAEESGRFADRARGVSLLGALVAFLLATSWMRRTWGEAGGLLGGALLATNGVFLEQSLLVACESWLMAFSIVWFDHLTRPGAPRGGGTRGALVAGVFGGLLYLTKGTGTLYLGAALVALVAVHRRRAWRPVLAHSAAFALVASPLLVRNVAVFQNPFYNVNSTHVLWLDHWTEFSQPQVLDAAGPLEWWRTHDLGDALRRSVVGGAKETLHLLEAFSPLHPSSGGGLLVLSVCALCVLRDPSRPRRVLMLVLFALFFVSFSWYAQVVQGSRFLAVLVPLCLGFAARLGPELCGGPRRLRGLRVGVVLVALGLAGAGVARGALAWRLDRFRAAPETEAVHAFLREHVGLREDVHYLMGPSDRLTCDWDFAVRGTRHSFPHTRKGFQRLLAGNDGDHFRYAFVERRGGSWPERFDAGWARPAGDGGLEPDAPPPGWSLVRRIPSERPTVLVFARD